MKNILGTDFRACRPLLVRFFAMSAASIRGEMHFKTLPGDLRVQEHILDVPLDHNQPDGQKISLFVRELVTASKANEDLPWLLFLQGGPGFPSRRPSCPPSGWHKAALEKYRVLLLDQRGTGRSSPVTTQLLQKIPGGPEAQACFLTYFRADSIVKDCEIIRNELAGGKQISLLGQSFGGFVILTYLSLFPGAIERALVTFGLAPIGHTADEVYRATFHRMTERNRKYYRRYPEDVELVREIVATLHSGPVTLPRGGTLTARRFLQLGLLLGSASGFETLHNLLELARPYAGGLSSVSSHGLPDHFLLEVESAQQQFETNPIYWLLHEAIYVDGAVESDFGKDGRLGAPSQWAAERVQVSLGKTWDYTAHLDRGGPPVKLTGEMVYSWMGDDYAWLRPLKPVANLLAAKTDWGPLYNVQALGCGTTPVAALVSYEDIYVERAFSEETATMLGDRAHLWITNEFQHSGLGDEPKVVFERLLAMSKGELAIPS